jgi:predicted AlkP superfamily pyrophosphatase or phosphodiesterase
MRPPGATYRKARRPLLLAGTLAVAFAGLATRAALEARGGEVAGSTLRLVVVVSIDQFPAGYLTRWGALFPPGGFRRLQEEGASYPDAAHGHFTTFTGPGHSVMLTGTYGRDSGIVGNRWYDRAKHADAYCVEDAAFPLVLPPGAPEKDAAAGASPLASSATSVGDALRLATGGRAKTISLSVKDRGAVLMAGRRPSGVYWLYPRTCGFVTSRYYAPDGKLPQWLESFNAANPCKPYVGTKWDRLRPDLDYALYADRDDAPYEKPVFGVGGSFPHPIEEWSDLLKLGDRDRDRFSPVFATPFGNQVMLALVEAAVEGESLGSDDTPDLLTISLSSNDYVGHQFGPDSQEALDATLRTDRVLAGLLGYLDERVGNGRYVLALTSDHGVAPIPEYLESRGLLPPRADHYHFDLDAARARLESALDKRFPTPDGNHLILAWSGETAPWIYLDPAAIGRVSPATTLDEVARTTKAELLVQDGVARVYTASDLAVPVPSGDRDALLAHRAFNQRNSGDLLVQLEPYWLYPERAATSHGTPYHYDTDVPLLLYGRGIKPGTYRRPVQVVDLAPTLAALLGVTPPPQCAGTPLVEALER